jgi:sugar lactone lactonase YvrE
VTRLTLPARATQGDYETLKSLGVEFRAVIRLDAELVLDARAALGEGPIWDARSRELVWVDIMAGLVHRFDPATGSDASVDAGQPVGSAVIRAAGGLALAVRDGFAVLDGEEMRMVAEVEADRPDLRMNDGAVDSRGRFWAGTMELDAAPGEGSLYRLDGDGSVELMIRGVSCSNGIAWNPGDDTMLYVDTPTLGIDAFDFDADSGAIANRRRLITIEAGAGSPDGLVVDAEGCIWVALWDGWAVRRYSPAGELLAVVEIPVARVTKPAFAGEVLYVTTASPEEPDPAQPHAGGVFGLRPGVAGLPPNPFAG